MNGDKFYTQLLSDRASILAALKPGARPELQGTWRNLMQHVSQSINTNGNSLLLRLDYGRSRTLLTGDLNTAAMRSLLDDYTGQRLVFACDVAKARHHGSDDVSYEFLNRAGTKRTGGRSKPLLRDSDVTSRERRGTVRRGMRFGHECSSD